MSCPEVQERLSDHLLGETSAEDRARIEDHIAGCPACASEHEGLRETIDLLAAHEWSPSENGREELSPERVRRLEERAAREPRRWGGVLLKPAAVVVRVVGMAAVMTPSLLRARVSLGGYAPSNAPQPEVWKLAEPKPEGRVQVPAEPSVAPGLSAVAVNGDSRVPPATMVPADGRFNYSQPGPEIDKLRSHGYVAAGPAGPGVPPDHALAKLQAPGLVPPNGAPARDMYFEHAGTNPFVVTAEDALSTFGLDVDTASYSIARSYIQRGALPPPSAVRVEEFVNALPQDYRADPAKTFTVFLEGAPHPFHRGYHLLRIGIKAREVAQRDRKPVVLTFVIDVSGSMAMENRLGLVKRSLRLLVEKLDERDRIGLVVYGTSGRVVLEPTPVSEAGTIQRAIDRLMPEGSTNMEQGLDLGYAMARRAFEPGFTNRVILCTDGVANNGITDAATLLKKVHGQAEKGVDLIALGFGMGNYNDVLLQKLADEGDGQYAYIDDFQDAERFFLRDLTQVLEVVARDAKAQVEFEPVMVERYRLIGYEKRDVADEKFRDDTVDGGELNAGHTVTVLYELKLKDGVSGSLGAVHLRYADPDSHQVTEVREVISDRRFRESFAAASPRFRLAALVARFAEHLRKSYWVKGEKLERVAEAAESLPPGLAQEPEVREFLDLLRRAAALQTRQE